MTEINSKIPEGPLAEKWSKHKSKINVVSPANKRKLDVIVVGTKFWAILKSDEAQLRPGNAKTAATIVITGE